MRDTITYLGTIVAHECGECGIWFVMPEDFKRQRLKDRRSWFCPNGHERHFTVASTEVVVGWRSMDSVLRDGTEFSRASVLVAKMLGTWLRSASGITG